MGTDVGKFDELKVGTQGVFQFGFQKQPIHHSGSNNIIIMRIKTCDISLILKLYDILRVDSGIIECNKYWWVTDIVYYRVVLLSNGFLYGAARILRPPCVHSPVTTLACINMSWPLPIESV